MKHVIIAISIISLISSCDFNVVEFDIKKVADIPGSIDSLPNNTQLNIISYSGFDDSKNNVWTQSIAENPINKNKYRIISPQIYNTRIIKSMNYSQIDTDEIKTLSALGNVHPNGDSENLESLLNKLKDNNLKEIFEEESFGEIEVFFNPDYNEEENLHLPIIIGKLE